MFVVIHIISAFLTKIKKKLGFSHNSNSFQERRKRKLNKEKRKKSFLKLDTLVNARKITFYVLAKDLNFTSTLFSDWKSGKSMPKTDKLIKIANYLGVSVDYFLDV